MLLAAGCDEKLISQLLEFFCSFDKDRSQKLDLKELRKMLGAVGRAGRELTHGLKGASGFQPAC